MNGNNRGMGSKPPVPTSTSGSTGIPSPTLSRNPRPVSRNAALPPAPGFSGNKQIVATPSSRGSVDATARNNNGQPQRPRNLMMSMVQRRSSFKVRRTMSHESLLSAPGFNTSKNTPAGGGMMNTSRRRGEGPNGDLGRSIAAPTDKKTLSEMAEQVFYFLEDIDCHPRPLEVNDLINTKNMTQTMFIGMIKFLATFFMGDSYFLAKEKPDAEAEKIIELMKLLKYPGTLSKSHLKTATVQHAWPSSLTFLSWLCSRTLALITPPETKRTDLMEATMAGGPQIDPTNAAVESYLNLFPHYRETGEALSTEIIDAEIENFKSRFDNPGEVEHAKTKEELIEEKNQKLADLDLLKNQDNPLTGLMNEHKAEMQNHNEIKIKIKKAVEDFEKYSDYTTMKGQQETLQLQIETKSAQLERLKGTVERQPFTKEESVRMIKEIEILSSQIDTARHINADLEMRYHTLKGALETGKMEFYDLCKEFSVVESFNLGLLPLKWNQYIITSNPFTPNELEKWMQEAGKKLEKVQHKMDKMSKEIDLRSQATAKGNQDFKDKMNNLMKEREECLQQLKAVQFYAGSTISAKYEQERTELQKDLNEKHAKLREEEEKLASVKQEKKRLYEKLTRHQECLEKLKAEEAECKKKVNTEMGLFEQHAKEQNNFLQEATTKAAAAQQKFYKEHAGIDIFKGLGDN